MKKQALIVKALGLGDIKKSPWQNDFYQIRHLSQLVSVVLSAKYTLTQSSPLSLFHTTTLLLFLFLYLGKVPFFFYFTVALILLIRILLKFFLFSDFYQLWIVYWLCYWDLGSGLVYSSGIWRSMTFGLLLLDVFT